MHGQITLNATHLSTGPSHRQSNQLISECCLEREKERELAHSAPCSGEEEGEGGGVIFFLRCTPVVICPSAWNVFTSKQRELLRSGFIGPRKHVPDVNGGVVAAVANVQSQARRWSEEGKEAEQNGDKHGVVLYGH